MASLWILTSCSIIILLIVSTQSLGSTLPERLSELDAFDTRICGRFSKLVYGRRETEASTDAKVRISAGRKMKPGEMPAFVRLQIGHKRTHYYLCGGVLIHNNLVLTAAHCIDKAISEKLIKASLGLSNQDRNSYMQRINGVRKFCRHKKWHPHNKGETRLHDIGLIQLSEAVKYDDYIKPACLPNPHNNSQAVDNTCCFMAGMGRTSDTASVPKVLHGMPMIDECIINSTRYEDVSCFTSADKFKYPGETCMGDSGGGLYCYDRTQHGGRYFAVAIASHGPVGCKRRARDRPNYFQDLRSGRESLIELFRDCLEISDDLE